MDYDDLMRVILGFIFLLLMMAPSVAGPPVEVKDIAAPPSDITTGRVRMPDPTSCAMSSCTALLPFDEVSRLERGDGKALVALMADDVESWSLKLVVDSDVPAVQGELQGTGPLMRDGLARVAVLGPELKSVEIRIDAPRKDAIGWVLLADGREDIRLRSHFESHAFLVGSPLIVHAGVDGAELLDGVVHLRSPSGGSVASVLAREEDSEGSALLELTAPGDWTVRTVVRVRDEEGVERIRTTQQLIRVERSEVTLAGEIAVEQAEDDRIELAIPISMLGAGEIAQARRVAVGCEIWGRRNGEGTEVPVCWVARMHELDPEGGDGVLHLRFDPRWISLADVEPGSLSLRELRIQSAGSFVPFVHEASPSFMLEGEILVPTEMPIKPVREMLAGHSGSTVGGLESDSMMSPAGHVMVVSHGYCNWSQPWPENDFTGDVEFFIDLNQNLTHDEFALRLEAFGRSFKSMGITGHSQGGNASAHLYTFYWSSLDWATGPRKIQALGTPWLGTSLASNIAVLGQIFGVGCGPNFDMTYDGSELWISWIPTWVREETWYWTTSFEEFPNWYDYCQIISDVLLLDPDDGVVEQWAGQLEGANNGGHKEAWCHYFYMRDPPHFTDAVRNAELNAESAR